MRHNSVGSLQLFRAFGVNVYVHWSWFVVAFIQFQFGERMYGGVLWHVLTYMALFAIVLLHEFGHALACRSVGGYADRIVLWPLGGIAFVQPPPRPGPVLWSIAAGPLVNVALVPVTLGLLLALGVPMDGDQWGRMGDVQQFFWVLAMMNLMLLVFNLIPVYPLDGGQILQAMLWFFVGRARSLYTVALIGLFIGVLAAVFLAYVGDLWLVLICGFVCWQSWIAFNQARVLLAMERR